MIRRLIISFTFILLFLVKSLAQNDSTKHYHSFYISPTYSNCFEANDTFIGRMELTFGFNFITNYSKGWSTEFGLEFSHINFRTTHYWAMTGQGGITPHGNSYGPSYTSVYNKYRIPFFEFPFLIKKQWQLKSRKIFVSFGPEVAIGLHAVYKITNGFEWGKYIALVQEGNLALFGFQSRIRVDRKLRSNRYFQFALVGNLLSGYIGNSADLKNKSYYTIGFQFAFLFGPSFQNDFEKKVK